MDSVFILHETQESSLCGQHCLNNLVQQTIFNAVDLAEIAQGLDEQERRFMMEGSQHDLAKFLAQESGNVDSSGNFSIEVLRRALQRSYDIDLVSWAGAEGRSQTDPTDEQAFVVNRDNHWFTIRKIRNHWWNLDSTLDKPVHVSPFYLSAYLSQLRAEGFTVFLARGNVPPGGVYLYSTDDYVGAVWYDETSLLSKSRVAPGDIRAITAVPPQTGFEDDDNDEDMMLAKAISASLS